MRILGAGGAEHRRTGDEDVRPRFRHLGEGTQTWAAKPLHHVKNGGLATNMVDWVNSQRIPAM